MKKHSGTRLLAMLLAVVMTLGLTTPSMLAAGTEANVAFKQVANDVLPSSLRSDLTQESTIEQDEGSADAVYSVHDVVRASIILEDASTLETFTDEAANGTLAESRDAAAYRETLQRRQDEVIRQISSRVLGSQKLDVVWNLTLVANIISANVEYGQIAQIRQLPGVKDVILEQQYEPAVYSADPAEPNMEISTGMTGTTTAWATGYTGAGMRIAIIDTGLDTDHQSFDAGAYEYALQQNAKRLNMTEEAYIASLDLLDEDEIAAKRDQLHVADGMTAAQLYHTGKIAFAYSYVDTDLDVTHENDTAGEHGSHVAGISAANRYLPDGKGGYVSALESVHMNGAAPDAQVLVMKVFGNNGGAYDSDYMVAIEDAIVLGADAINLSLGSSSPGMVTSRTAEYQKILDELTNTASVVSISAGNAGYWAENTNPGLLYSDGLSMHTGGSPGTFANAFTVASVDNDGFIGNYFLMNQDIIAPTETTGYSNQPIATIEGEHEFVFFAAEENKYAVDANGSNLLTPYADLVSGKIVFVSRGASSFYQKHDAVGSLGALACVVYNNQPGSINMDLSDSKSTVPCVSITQADGELIRAQAEPVYGDDGVTVLYYTGKIKLCGKEPVRYNAEYKTMSSFSSWGVPGNLTMKPEITAPGGSIYSLNGYHKDADHGMLGGHDAYELMSGTSMAAPQIAGISALVKQYIEQNNLSVDGLTDRALAQSLMMSTAQPLVNGENGSYYSVLQQGAGLVDAAAATSADSYILMQENATRSWADGKVKAELGDDPSRTGSYDFGFTIHNLDGKRHSYTLNADLFTQALLDYEGQTYMDTLTTALSAAVTWTINGKDYSELFPLSRDYDYNNDGQVDLLDGQLLLDVAAGKPGAEILNRHAVTDLSGDGALTAYDVHLFLNLLQQATVDLRANGEAEVVCHIRLLDRQALDDAYPTGAYVEGYVQVQALASADGAAGTCHSIPVLGYYGGWTESSMFDVGTLAESVCNPDLRTPYLANVNRYGYTVANYLNMQYAGEQTTSPMIGNPVDFDDAYLPARNAFNNQNGNQLVGYVFALIRNAGNSRLQIVNSETGETYFDHTYGAASSAYYLTSAQTWRQKLQQLNFTWAGYDSNGTALPDGTSVDVTLTMAPEYYAGSDGSYRWDALQDGASLSTHFTIDNAAPELLSVTQDLQQGKLDVSAQDNRYLAAVLLWNIDDTSSPVSYILPNQAEDALGQPVSCSFDLSSLADGSKLLLQVVDYAYNVSTYQLITGEEPADTYTSLTLSPAELSLLQGSTYTLEADTEPYYVNDKLDWTSSNPAVATVNANGFVNAVAAGETVITAASHKNPSLSAACTVRVSDPDYTFRGVLNDQDKLQTFTWNFKTEETWQPVAEIKGIASRIPSAAASSADTVYLQAVDGKAYDVDFQTGKILSTGSAQYVDYMGMYAPYDDFVTSKVFRGEQTLHNDLVTGVYSMNVTPMQDPMNGDSTSAISIFDIFGHGASGFVAIASAGQGSYTDKDTGNTHEEAEKYYLLDDANNIWLLWLYQGEDGSYYGAYQRISTDLQLEYPGDENWNMLCSLTVADDGELFLTQFNGTTSALYWLRYDSQSETFRSARLGSFGDTTFPVSVTEVRTNHARTDATSAFEQAKGQFKTVKAAPITQGNPAAGTLNSVVPVREAVSPAEQLQAVNGIARMTLTADAATVSGIATVRYNPEELQLRSVSGASTLSTWYELTPGTILFAYAERSRADAGEVLGTLEFSFLKQNITSQVEVQTQQQDEQIYADGEGPAYTATLDNKQANGSTPSKPANPSKPSDDHSKTCPSLRYDDLDTTQWYHEYLDAVLREGLMNGASATRFDPHGVLTRGMLVTILWRMEGKPVVNLALQYADVAPEAYYTEAVRWATAEGIVNGFSSTAFGPNDPITREQLAAILFRLAAKKGWNVSSAGSTLPDFADRDQISSWAGEAMSWAYTHGVVTGKGANRLDPAGTATRAEAAAMIVRFGQLAASGDSTKQ